MSDQEKQPLFYKSDLALTELIKPYGSEDDLGIAISAAETKTYELMRSYPDGVPSGVMFAGTTKAVEWITELLASMIVDLAGLSEKWDTEMITRQQELTNAVITLLRAHAVNTVLEGFTPLDEREDDEQP